jgi:hypothetical protein
MHLTACPPESVDGGGILNPNHCRHYALLISVETPFPEGSIGSTPTLREGQLRVDRGQW